MATAFTPREREQIDESLCDAALRCAATTGMKHSTVDELSHQAGISKGAFYGFYESKEHLFLSMLERLHQEMYGSAERVLEQRVDLPVRKRVTLAIRQVCAVAEKRDVVTFLRDEVPLLLRRLPENTLKEHYRSDEERIRALIQKSGVHLTTSMDTACAVVRLLLMTLIVKRDVGDRYDDALRLMIEGACQTLIALR